MDSTSNIAIARSIMEHGIFDRRFIEAVSLELHRTPSADWSKLTIALALEAGWITVFKGPQVGLPFGLSANIREWLVSHLMRLHRDEMVSFMGHSDQVFSTILGHIAVEMVATGEGVLPVAARKATIEGGIRKSFAELFGVSEDVELDDDTLTYLRGWVAGRISDLMMPNEIAMRGADIKRAVALIPRPVFWQYVADACNIHYETLGATFVFATFFQVKVDNDPTIIDWCTLGRDHRARFNAHKGHRGFITLIRERLV